MSEYAKITEGQIQFAPRKLPRKIEIDGELVDFITTNPTGEMLAEAGFLPIVWTEQPDDAPAGYCYEAGWAEDDGQIVQTWTLVEDPNADEISAEEALELLTGGEADEED